MISDKYLDTVFNLRYFAHEATCIDSGMVFNVIPNDEDIDASLQDFHILSAGNRYLIKTSDVYKCQLEEDIEITIKDIKYIIKSFKGRLDGTTEIVVENRE